jgi:hypothetical protein
MAHASDRYQKIAMIIGRVMLTSKIERPDFEIHKVIVSLVEDGKLECQGDLHKMRYGEVRRP